MKKIICLIMCVISLFMFTGCSDKTNENPNNANTQTEELTKKEERELKKIIKETEKQNAEIEETSNRIIKENNIKEVEFSKDCDHKGVEYVIESNDNKYLIKIKECKKCNGKQIVNIMDIDETKEDPEDIGKRIDNLFK